MNIFSSTDHREILNAVIEDRKKAGDALSFSTLAKSVGLQKSYVSKVMAGEACWGADQVFALTSFLNLGADEAEYFTLLVEIERSGLEARRKFLQTKIKNLRRRNLRSQNVLKSEKIDRQDSIMAEYFADPYHSLVHVYLNLPKYQKNMERLGKTLGITRGHLEAILGRLEKLALIKYERSNDQVRILKSFVHTPTNNELVHAHQMMYRALSLDRLARCSPDRKNTYSAVFAGDVSFQESLWAGFLEYLKKVEEAAIGTAQANEVFYLQFDLFPWNGGETP